MQTINKEKIPWWSDDDFINNKIVFILKLNEVESSNPFDDIIIKSRVIYTTNVIITVNLMTDTVHILKNRYDNDVNGRYKLNVYDFQKKLIEHDIKYIKLLHESDCLHQKIYDEYKDILSAIDLNLI